MHIVFIPCYRYTNENVRFNIFWSFFKILLCIYSLSRNLCIFDRQDSSRIFDLFKNDKNDDRGDEPELIVFARKTKFLNNHLKEGQKKYTSSRLKCYLYGDNGKRKQKHATDFIYVSKAGKAR